MFHIFPSKKENTEIRKKINDSGNCLSLPDISHDPGVKSHFSQNTCVGQRMPLVQNTKVFYPDISHDPGVKSHFSQNTCVGQRVPLVENTKVFNPYV